MSFAVDDATETLRRRVLNGEFPPGAKLREVAVAEELGVSRTIARLAMSGLEHEGLLTREPNRGCRVNYFSIQQIVEAIEVRGELEAMAARQASERGLDRAMADRLSAIVAREEALLQNGVQGAEARAEWVALNVRFHEAMIEASGNWAVRVAVRQMWRLPLVSPDAFIFEQTDAAKSRLQLLAAHEDHVEILHAVQARQGHRAEARMREHACASARNKRSNLADPEAQALTRGLPGGALVRADL